MRRVHKLVVAGLVFLAASGVILWNTAAQEGPTMMGVADAKRNALGLEGQDVTVRGSVVAESIVYNGTRVETFVLSDGHEDLLVAFGRTPPDAFGPKDVVVHGTLAASDDGAVRLDAQDIQVGCASKY